MKLIVFSLLPIYSEQPLYIFKNSPTNLKIIFLLKLQELSQKLGDDKSLTEHLQLPIQRINDYQLLLKVSIDIIIHIIIINPPTGPTKM